jgi:hypothetical protein
MDKMLLPWEEVVLKIEALPRSTNIDQDIEDINKSIKQIEDQEVIDALNTLIRYYQNQLT